MSETVTEAPSQVTGEREQLLSALADADASAFDLTANTISMPQVEKPSQESAKEEDTPEEEAPEQQPEEEKPEETQEEEQPKSKYSRAKKSQDRANKSWREVNEAKAALKKEREELEAQKKAYQDGHEKSLEEIQQRTNTSRYSPEEYESIAQEFEDEGDHANAEAARKAAKQARQTATEQEQKKQQAEFVSKWDTNWKQATASHKDLNDQESDLFKMVGQLLERKPVLTQYPEGITDAVEAADMYLKANRSSDLEKQVSDLKKQVAEYEEKLTLNGSQPGGTMQIESFDKLSADRQRAELVKAMSSADESGVGMFAN
tara:strand:- start:1759 stop:2712 length:954 start_codon:yes stop_codon:yes gene_type:complete